MIWVTWTVKRDRLLFVFIVITKLSYLFWVNYHQPPENTLIKKKNKKQNREKLCIFLLAEY